MGGPATFEEELPVPRVALIKAGCAKCREGVYGKKSLRVKKISLTLVALELLWQMYERSVRQKAPGIKKISLKSVTLAVQQHKNEVPNKKQSW